MVRKSILNISTMSNCVFFISICYCSSIFTVTVASFSCLQIVPLDASPRFLCMPSENEMVAGSPVKRILISDRNISRDVPTSPMTRNRNSNQVSGSPMGNPSKLVKAKVVHKKSESKASSQAKKTLETGVVNELERRFGRFSIKAAPSPSKEVDRSAGAVSVEATADDKVEKNAMATEKPAEQEKENISTQRDDNKQKSKEGKNLVLSDDDCLNLIELFGILLSFFFVFQII